jgi:hypothetical protein
VAGRGVVRRRQVGRGPAVPEVLCRFVAGEWPGATAEERFRTWCEARLEYVRQHGDGTVLGDPLDVIRGHAEYKRRHAL